MSDSGMDCCDSPGGVKTYRNQVCMPLNGKVQCIDKCIHHIVAALNAGGVRTVASCCGHKQMPGDIVLEDGRALLIFDSLESAWALLPRSESEGPVEDSEESAP